MNTKRLLHVLIVLLVCVALYGFHDAEFKEKIIGSWNEKDALETGVTLDKVFIFSSDGTFSVLVKRTERDKISSYNNYGTWTLERDVLHYTITKSTHPKIPIGHEYTNKIIRITDKEIVSSNPDGKVTTAYRAK